MFWKKSAGNAEPAPKDAAAAATPMSAETTAHDPMVDELLDTVGTMLKAMGDHAIDIEGRDAGAVRAEFERWRRHAMTGAPLRSEQTSSPIAKRDWAGLRKFVVDHRREEQRHAGKAVGSLQEIVWAFVHDLNRSAALDQEADADIEQTLKSLQLNLDGKPLPVIRQEILNTVNSVTRVMADRTRRQQEQIAQLGHKLEEMQSELRQARHESALDGLTRLFNRKALDEFLAQTVDLYKVFYHPACLALIDVDRFKQINDTYGHPAGDSLLIRLANTLSSTFVAKGDCVARYGGEEFAVVMRNLRPEAAAAKIDRLLREVRSQEVCHDGLTMRYTISVGLTALQAGDNAAVWLERADKGLYQAKNTGRDRLVVMDTRLKAA